MGRVHVSVCAVASETAVRSVTGVEVVPSFSLLSFSFPMLALAHFAVTFPVLLPASFGVAMPQF